jgi:cysteine synthase A
VAHGEIRVEGSSITEGIGNSRITANLEGTEIEDAVRVSDEDAVRMVYRLLHEEGLYVGGSSGINVCAAVETARRLGPGHTVVTILCDGGDRYRSRLFNRSWLETKGLSAAAV